MSLWHLIIKEMALRWLNFLLAVVAVMLAVACVVGSMVSLQQFDSMSEALIAAKQAAVEQQIADMEDEFRQITKAMGFNILVLPKEQSLADFYEWSEGTVGVHITFNANSIYDVNEFDVSDSTLYYESGIYTTVGSQIVVTATSQNGSAITPAVFFDGSWAISGNTLTLTTSSEGTTIVLTWTKVV